MALAVHHREADEWVVRIASQPWNARPSSVSPWRQSSASFSAMAAARGLNRSSRSSELSWFTSCRLGLPEGGASAGPMPMLDTSSLSMSNVSEPRMATEVGRRDSRRIQLEALLGLTSMSTSSRLLTKSDFEARRAVTQECDHRKFAGLRICRCPFEPPRKPLSATC